MNKLKEVCVSTEREYCFFFSDNKRDAACCHHSLSLSFSLHCAHLPPRLHGMSSIYYTQTYVPPTLVFCHVGCSVSRDQGASRQPLGSLSGHPNVSGAMQSKPSATPSPSHFNSHAMQPPPSGITGHPWQLVSDCGGGWGMRCHLCWESMSSMQEVEDGEDMMSNKHGGRYVRAEMLKSADEWQNIGEDRCWWMSAGGRQKQKNTDMDGD